MRKILLLMTVALVGVASTAACKNVGTSSDHGSNSTRVAPTSVPGTTQGRVPSEPAVLSGCTKVPNGGTCHLRGSGFGFGEIVRLTFTNTGKPPEDVKADQRGKFADDFSILTAPGVVITVQAQGRDSGRRASLSYTIT